MFDRTPQGIANEHLFYNVEFVVYCEGREVEDESASTDEAFWNRLFTLYGRNVKCKSRGSKSSLKQLAHRIVEDRVSNVVVAMDRDYDDFGTMLIDHPQVMYTHGYSWESDSLNGFDFQLVFSLFVNVHDPHDFEDRYNCFIERQSRILKRVFALDLKYFNHEQSLFDRNKPMSIVVASKRAEPKINVKKLLESAKAMGQFQTIAVSKAAYERVNGMFRFHGKTVAHFIYQWFVFASKNIRGSRNVAYLAFMNATIGTLSIDNMEIPRNQYFCDIMNRLNEHV